MEHYKQMGRHAYIVGEVRVAPLAELLRHGLDAVDAWYEGYDDARGHGPYYGTTAQARRDAYVP